MRPFFPFKIIISPFYFCLAFERFLAILLKFCSADHPSSLRKILTAKPQKSSQNPTQFDLKIAIQI